MPSGVGGGILSSPPVKPDEGALWVFVNGAWQQSHTVTAPVAIDLGSGVLPAAVGSMATAGQTLRLIGLDGQVGARMGVYSFGNSAFSFNGFAAAGTRAAPDYPQAGYILCRFNGVGWDTSLQAYATGGILSLDTGSLWSATNRETTLTFVGVSSGSTSLVTWWQLKNAAMIVGADPGGSDTVRIAGALTISDTKLLTSKTTLTDFSGAGAGTLTNAPTAGNPSKWISVNDNGTVRKIPTWT